MDPVTRVRKHLLDNVGHLTFPGEASFDESARQWSVPVFCRTAHGPVEIGQILLDEADGCDHLTVFECTFFPVVKKEAIKARLGKVSPNRRRPLHQTIAAALRLFQ